MIDLHELANMPGAGKATMALKKAGFWDEDAGKECLKFKVEGTVRFDVAKVISARSENEAKEIFVELVADDHDCDDMDVGVDNINPLEGK